jgi:hypothetical protein
MVTEIDIGAALLSCNLIKTKSSPEQILGIFRSCPKAPVGGPTPEVSPRLRERAPFWTNVAGHCRGFEQGM